MLRYLVQRHWLIWVYYSLWCRKPVDCQPLHRLILQILASTPETQVRFILDSTSCPEIISLTQFYGQEIQDRILYLTRTWAFAIHREKMKILGRWPECHQPSHIHPKPSSPPSPNEATLPVPPTRDTPSNDSSDIAFTDTMHTQLTKDSSGSGECFSNGISFTESNLINNLIVAGSTNAHLPRTSTPPTHHKDYNTTLNSAFSLVPAEPTVVHSDQPPDAMPETTSFTICSNLSPSEDCVVGLDKNLAGHGGGHGVMGCSHSSVSGHHQSESASLSIFWSTNLSEQCSQH